MITANSRRAHFVDTSMSGRGGMVNLNSPATAPGPLIDSDLQHFDGTPIPPPAVLCAPRRRSLLQSLRRAVLGPIYRYHLRCIREERAGYQDAGMPLGPRYLAACDEQERDLRSRLAMLEIDC